MTRRWPTALTIAGSDSGGGAGIQADLKTFAAHDVYGMSAVCAVTAQHTRGVTRIDAIPAAGVRAQLEAVFSDLPVDAVKIGMLGAAAVVHTVADFLESLPERPPVVLDPVMVATSGDVLLERDAIAALTRRLLPLATIVTPNLPEAVVLCGSQDAEGWAARVGVPVLLTGGDAPGDTIVDRLVLPDGRVLRWEGPRLGTVPVHGTGCTLSSAIAAHLARGGDLEGSVDAAIAWVRHLIGSAVQLGGGSAVVHHRQKAAGSSEISSAAS